MSDAGVHDPAVVNVDRAIAFLRSQARVDEAAAVQALRDEHTALVRLWDAEEDSVPAFKGLVIAGGGFSVTLVLLLFVAFVL